MPAQYEVELTASPALREAVSDPGVYSIENAYTGQPSDPAASSLLALASALQASQQRPRSAFVCKRAIDLAGASLIVVFLLPVLVLCCLIVLITSSSPVFFSHRRIGRGGREFSVWKFRTMCENPDQVLQDYLQAHPEKRDEWMSTQKLTNDPRVTPAGRFMRRFSLDELPQLWNVISGDMSLIGPRPIVKTEVQKYGDAIRAYYAVRPGMTGLWQVSGRSNTTYSERVRLDRRYSEEWSLSMELAILFSTFRVVLTGDGAY